MSKTAKAAGSASGSAVVAEEELPFEEAMAQLESIVEGMEAAELPLEQLMAKFEAGARLAKLCQARLAAAEVRIQQLEKNLAGEWDLRPVQMSGTAGTD